MFDVTPSDAVFEATIHSTANNTYTVERDIGRLNFIQKPTQLHSGYASECCENSVFVMNDCE